MLCQLIEYPILNHERVKKFRVADFDSHILVWIYAGVFRYTYVTNFTFFLKLLHCR